MLRYREVSYCANFRFFLVDAVFEFVEGRMVPRRMRNSKKRVDVPITRFILARFGISDFRG